MRIIFVLFTLFLIGANAGTLSIDSAQSMLDNAKKVVKVISPKSLKKMIDEDEDFYLLDIREPDQIGHGEIFHLDQIAITRGYLEFKIESHVKDKNAPIVVYCCTGKRGLLAAKTLQDMGYKNVMSLEGGIRKWVEDGFPLFTVYGEMTYNQ